MSLVPNSAAYKLTGRRVLEVEHFDGGSVYVYCDDGTKIEFQAIGHHITARDDTPRDNPLR